MEIKDEQYMQKLLEKDSKHKEYLKQYYVKNKDKISDKRKNTYINNKQDEDFINKKKEYNRTYYQKNKDKNKIKNNINA